MKLPPAKFLFRNSAADRRLLLSALALVCGVRMGLWFVPFRVLSRVVTRFTAKATSEALQVPQDRELVKRVASSVRRASCYFPSASCLTQALATQVLLARRGQLSTLRIGVSKDTDGELKAHAWVESSGKIVIGQRKDLRTYTVLNRLEEVSQ